METKVNNTPIEVDGDEEVSQNTTRSYDITKKGEDITQVVETPSSRFKLILVIPSIVAQNTLTSEDIVETQ